MKAFTRRWIPIGVGIASAFSLLHSFHHRKSSFLLTAHWQDNRQNIHHHPLNKIFVSSISFSRILAVARLNMYTCTEAQDFAWYDFLNGFRSCFILFVVLKCNQNWLSACKILSSRNWPEWLLLFAVARKNACRQSYERCLLRIHRTHEFSIKFQWMKPRRYEFLQKIIMRTQLLLLNFWITYT